MILPGTTEFPDNVIALIAARIPGYVDVDLNGRIHKRPLRETDEVQCVGIFPSTKLPDITTQEINGFESVEPSIKRYGIIVQAMVQDTDEEAAVSVHSILAQRLWRMLYRDNALAVGLTALSVSVDNSIERFQRRGITVQRYVSNEIQGNFVRTCWIEFWFDTETVRIN